MNNKGMTLIELMVVIGAIAVLLALSTPSIIGMIVEKRVRGAAMLVQSNLVKARMQAVSQNIPVIVALPNPHQFMIVRDTNANSIADSGETGAPIDVRSGFTDIAITPGTSGYKPVFYPNGTALPGELSITSSQTATVKTIRISSSGRIKTE